jgi:hypothetical protein
MRRDERTQLLWLIVTSDLVIFSGDVTRRLHLANIPDAPRATVGEDAAAPPRFNCFVQQPDSLERQGRSARY